MRDHTIPLIDISPLLGTDLAARAKTVQAIGAACRGIGFFYVQGHGIPESLAAAVFAQSARFFAAPDALKASVSIARSAHNRGYVGFGIEALDPTRPADRKEAFNLGLELAADDPEVMAGRPFRGVNLWPELPEFRPTMLAWFDALWNLGRRLQGAMAVDLGLAADHFEPFLDRPMATLRLLHYPPAAVSAEPGELGAGAHTDYGCLTLLATDAVGGLEVRTRDGQWLKAPAIPNSFVCNIGDCLMRWTNDVYVSTPHRVVSPKGAERYSVAFFLDPNPEAPVACLPGCAGPDRPERYPPILAADYLRSRLDATYGTGKVGAAPDGKAASA